MKGNQKVMHSELFDSALQFRRYDEKSVGRDATETAMSEASSSDRARPMGCVFILGR
jgi:hypothetical protein